MSEDLAAENAQLRAELAEYAELLTGGLQQSGTRALQYEKPKLSATVMVMDGKNFPGLAERLENSRKRVGLRLVESEPNDAV
jgi:hypothetical protein